MKDVLLVVSLLTLSTCACFQNPDLYETAQVCFFSRIIDIEDITCCDLQQSLSLMLTAESALQESKRSSLCYQVKGHLQSTSLLVAGRQLQGSNRIQIEGVVEELGRHGGNIGAEDSGTAKQSAYFERSSDNEHQDATGASHALDAPEGAAESEVSAGAVLGLTTIMAAASGLGAIPFFFVGKMSAHYSALANAVACGVMLAASFDLVHEGEPYGAGLVITGLMLGE
jgi:hypothetical protein